MVTQLDINTSSLNNRHQPIVSVSEMANSSIDEWSVDEVCKWIEEKLGSEEIAKCFKGKGSRPKDK